MIQLRDAAILSVEFVDMIRLIEIQLKEINNWQTALLMGELRMNFFGLEQDYLSIILNPDKK